MTIRRGFLMLLLAGLALPAWGDYSDNFNGGLQQPWQFGILMQTAFRPEQQLLVR